MHADKLTDVRSQRCVAQAPKAKVQQALGTALFPTPVAIYAREVLNKDKKGRRGLYKELGRPMDKTVELDYKEKW